MFHCWALRWTTFTDSERSSSYLSALLWQPCSPDRVVLEIGPPSSLSTSIVDWRPGHKHNYILFLWSFSAWLFTDLKITFLLPVIAVHCCSVSTRGKTWKRCPVFTTNHWLLYHSHRMSLRASSVSAGEPEDRYAHYEEIILWGFLSCWTSLTDDLKLTSSWRLDQNQIARSGPLLLIMTIMRLILQLKRS